MEGHKGNGDFNTFVEHLNQIESYWWVRTKNSHGSECTYDKAAAVLGNFQGSVKLGRQGWVVRQGVGIVKWKGLTITVFSWSHSNETMHITMVCKS